MSKLPKIFLVDDDPDDALLLQEAIRSENNQYRFEHCQDGRTALECLKKDSESGELPCLIILDINMPVLDGRQLLAILKKDEQYSNIPIVVFTTSSSPADHAYCKQFDVELIIKPFNMAMMQEIVRRILPYCAA